MAAEKEDRDMRRAPCVARSPTAYEQAGQKHGRTIPLAATRAAKCFTIISLSLRAPLSASPCRLRVGPHARAIEKHHAELDPTVLNKVQQALPDASSCPADEELGRPPPGPQLLGDSPPLGPVLMPPQNGRKGATQVLWRGLAFRPAHFNQGLQKNPLSVAEHCSSSSRRTKTQDDPISSSDDTP